MRMLECFFHVLGAHILSRLVQELQTVIFLGHMIAATDDVVH